MLICFENTKLKKYIGYQKVKSYILVDYNLYPLAEKVFGKGIFHFYDLEVKVNNDVIYEEKIGTLTKVYQTNEKLYATYLGSVTKIDKKEEYYDVSINLASGTIVIKGLVSVDVFLYQKIEANTIIGTLNSCEVGYYYYYEKS